MSFVFMKLHHFLSVIQILLKVNQEVSVEKKLCSQLKKHVLREPHKEPALRSKMRSKMGKSKASPINFLSQIWLSLSTVNSVNLNRQSKKIKNVQDTHLSLTSVGCMAQSFICKLSTFEPSSVRFQAAYMLFSIAKHVIKTIVYSRQETGTLLYKHTNGCRETNREFFIAPVAIVLALRGSRLWAL